MTSRPELPDLPNGAELRVTEWFESGAEHVVAHLVGDEVVLVRSFYEDGQVELHSPRRAGVRHGDERYWDSDGWLRSLTPYRDGLEHGEAVQWDPSGVELGRYTMRHGTGLDLWRAQRSDGTSYLAEVRYMVSGERHGHEWILGEDQTSVHRESRYAAGTEHGIFREWADDGRLVGGHPRYYLLGRTVPADEYVAARALDPGLPAYEVLDDLPGRVWPLLVRTHLESRALP